MILESNILEKNTDHIIEFIMKYYPVDADCIGGLYCIIKLDWTSYQMGCIDLFMPKYTPNGLHEFHHPYTKRPQMNYTNGNAQNMEQQNNGLKKKVY